ncbi:putative PEP-binding protein [Fervidobacterium thailandense]|uniref:Phosphoenolpyruvate--protein phosphotransferase n=1 Tax=Fervidobacterium thailandense TaxID=1008305 RepID=A0A1E3G128_9BACT|nr:putative PEP-binding protein [Fervidobacterium thailandense]ODN29954.1 hypothetical protein A4H02_08085 [Fervidobacterium thailandense]
MRVELKGRVLNPGICVGPVFELRQPVNLDKRFSEDELLGAIERLRKKYESYDDYLMQARSLILEDEEFLKILTAPLKSKGYIEAKDFDDAKQQIEQIFSNVANDYVKERLYDFKDIIESIKMELFGTTLRLSEKSIVYAHEIYPSFIIENRDKILGIIALKGSETAHATILARNFDIPYVVNVELLGKIAMILPDGTVIFDPTDDDFARYEQIQRNYRAQKDMQEKFKNVDIVVNGQSIHFMANVGTIEEADFVDVEVGLLRTEFLLESKPDFEFQYNVYKKIAQKIGKPITLRTFDIGGDKEFEFLNLPKENNPFLGKRGVRLYDVLHDLINDQVEAVFRLVKEGYPFKIMIPMVSDLREIYEFHERFIAPRILRYGVKPPYGIMIETPSIALSYHHARDILDFASIGTNDLLQYTVAVERGNESISHLYDHLNIGFLKLIELITSKSAGIELSVCGESARIPELVYFYVSKGIRRLSMSYNAISKIKYFLSRFSTIDDVEVDENTPERLREVVRWAFSKEN